MRKYKKGVFVNISDSNPSEWESSFKRFENLPTRDHVEIWLEYIPKVEEARILRDMLQGTEVIVHGPFIHLSLVTHLKALGDISLKRCYEAVEVASSIGAKVITFHAGTYPSFENRDIAFERLAGLFSGLASISGPTVTLENMPVKNGTTRQCLGKLEDLKQLQSMIPNVHFTLDIGHSLQNGDDFESFLRENSSIISDIHLHDGRHGRRSHLCLGAGTLNLKRLVKALVEIPFVNYVSLETITLDDTLASWEVWLKAEDENGI